MIHAFLPGATQSVPAGKLHLQEEGVELLASRFVYGLKYLKRNGAIEVDPVGLGMLHGQQVARQELFAQESALFGGIRDAAPMHGAVASLKPKGEYRQIRYRSQCTCLKQGPTGQVL